MYPNAPRQPLRVRRSAPHRYPKSCETCHFPKNGGLRGSLKQPTKLEREKKTATVTTMNPYAQGGWSNSYNPNAVNNQAWGTSPSVYGALPYSAPPTAIPNFLRFTFSPLDGTILNALVMGPQSRTYFRISTDSTSSGFSVVQNSKLESVALVEWRSHPIVEIQNIVSKRSSSQWLELSPDKM